MPYVLTGVALVMVLIAAGAASGRIEASMPESTAQRQIRAARARKAQRLAVAAAAAARAAAPETPIGPSWANPPAWRPLGLSAESTREERG
ncbi:MAG: hypothetical protein LBT54_01820 [Bifidobacteriaceae bacterium]|jgi:hypothetical protein|nr:hypothetical protein [Bifidobacteriaceae bacterium]